MNNEIVDSVDLLVGECHNASRNAGWWHDNFTGEDHKPENRNKPGGKAY